MIAPIACRSIVGALTAALAVLFLPTAARAGGLIVSPVVLDKAVKKSGEALPPVKVTNGADEEWDITIEFKPLFHDEAGSPLPAPPSYKYTAQDMLSTKTPKFKLAAGASRDVEVKVTLPKGRSGGGYAIMYVLGEPSKKKPGETIAANVRVGVLVELVLPGEAKQRIKAGKVFAVQEASGAPIILHANAQNLGDVHAKVSGTIVVETAKEVVAKVPIEAGNVFPGLSRNLRAVWRAPKTLAPGNYKLTAAITGPGLVNETAFGDLAVIKPGEAAQHRVIVNKFQAAPVVQYKPVPLEATVTNTGNTPFVPKGRVVYTDPQGEQVATAELAATEAIPVGKKGTLKGNHGAGLPMSKFNAKLEVLSPAGALLATFYASQQVIEKDVNLAGKISKFAAPNDKEPYVTLEFKNEGNVEVDAEGIVMVADGAGNIVGQIPLEKQKLAIGGSASYKRGLPEGLESGLYELRAVVNFGGKTPATMTLKHFVQ